MRTSRQWVVRALAIVMVQASVALATAGTSFQLVSSTDPQLGPPSGGGGDSYLPVLSPDGRYVLFSSTANNLVTLETNRGIPARIPAPLNVFLRDRVKGSTTLISISADGQGGGDADSVPIGVSTNGRYALFESLASNLVAGDTNNASDVFIRDLVTSTTILVSVNTNGVAGDNASYSSAMTPDGRYVAFSSAADDLITGDTNGIPDVFVRDLGSNVTALVSVGAQVNTNFMTGVGSDTPWITPDSRFIAFYSTAIGLVPAVKAGGNLYVRDQASGIITWASAGAAAALGTLGAATNAVSFNAALGEDGRFLAFEAVAYPNNSPAVILRFDSLLGHTDLIETNAALSTGGSYEGVQDLSMTPDGRFVGYVAKALNNSGDTTAIRVWDAQTGLSVLASGNSNGEVAAGDLSDAPVLTPDGHFVAFTSEALDLVTNDIPGDLHLYLRDLQANTTMLVDADTNGVGSPLDATVTAGISADGRFVAFDSWDGSLVAADRNQAYDVFVRDVIAATNQLISAHDPGLASLTPDGPSSLADFSLSTDGRWVAFWSEADNLVTSDTNGVRDIYVRDSLAQTNILVSVATNGFAADGLSSEPAISGDGRFVAFSSLADNLVSGDINSAQDVFVRDLQLGAMQLVSVNSAGTGPGNKDSYSPVISTNGQFVLFRSKATNLTPGIFPIIEKLFWRDLQAARTYALTTNGVTDAAMTPDGSRVAFIASSSTVYPTSDQLNVWDSGPKSRIFSLSGGTSATYSAVTISADGTKIAWVSYSAGVRQLWMTDLVASTNYLVAQQVPVDPELHLNSDGRFLVYLAAATVGSPVQAQLYDLQTGTNTVISRSYNGLSFGDGDCDSIKITGDGRFVSYRSAADNLVPNDNNGVPDVFLYDRLSSGTTLVTASRFGNFSADNRSLAPVFSGDSRTLAFVSWASDLLSNDFNNNADVFTVALYDSTSVQGFTITAVPVAGTTPCTGLCWPAISGKSYRVQFKSDLGDLVWQELNLPLTIVNGQASVQDTAPIGTRFYRVVAF